ncbi:MAG TPA: ABC transporter substrate-binding protein, partial [Polyangiaceae bacterium]|nr:ABC transporter substrate-binding protein [Polyangiaceae bacterium]
SFCGACESPAEFAETEVVKGGVRTVHCLSTLLLAIAVCSLSGCGKKSSSSPAPADATPPAQASLKLALDWVPEPEFGGFYAGRESGAYKRHGIGIEIQGGGAGVPVLQMVATGRADFGTVGADELLTARARGADLVALFAVFQTSPQGIMVHASRKLQKLEDAFHSGTLALETGKAYAAYLKQKFSWEGVKVVPYDGGVAHFLTDPTFGQQCYVTSEPIAARQKGADPTVFLIADSGFNPYATVVVTRRELLQKQPQLVKEFVLATREGWREYLDHPQPTNVLLGKLNSSLDAATLDAAAEAQKPLIENAESKQHGLGSMQLVRWQTLADQLLQLKFLDKPVGVGDSFQAL